jgi:biotin transport system ATP-binding protein
MAHLIDLQDVCYRPGGNPVLEGITLAASERRIGVVGRNGSGKTSLARVMAGLVEAEAGTVRIAGADVARDRRAALRAVGILFQNPDHQIIFPTVVEEIAFGLRQMGQDARTAEAEVDCVLDRFDKAHWRDAAIHRLSQGQRQLVCLMSVLAMAPRVIILDEPFAGLDIPTAAQLTRVLAGLEATLVQITHDPATLTGFDRVLWIDGGQIRQDGAPEPVLRDFGAEMARQGAGDDLSDLAG